MSAVILESKGRLLAVLPSPVPCPKCHRAAMMVVLSGPSATCIGCAPGGSR